MWAEEVDSSGTITTKEGSTDFQAGDYLVFNDEEGRDGYAVSQEKFRSLHGLGDD